MLAHKINNCQPNALTRFLKSYRKTLMHAHILKTQERERGKSGHYPHLPVMQMFACLFKETHASILRDEKPS